MALSTMYQGKAYSPPTELTQALTIADTTINVADASVFPPAPNIAVIGIDENAETIIYTGMNGSALTGVTRGVEGSAKAWSAGAPVARNFTAYDYDALVANLQNVIVNLSAMAHVYVKDGDVFVSRNNLGEDVGGEVSWLNMGVLARLGENAGALTFKQTPVGITLDGSDELVTRVVVDNADTGVSGASYYQSGDEETQADGEEAVNDYYK